MPKTTYFANKVLDWICGNQALPNLTSLYFGLITNTTAPTIAGGGSEVSGGSYARASLTNNSSSFDPATPGGSGGAAGTKINKVVITFPQATASWGTVNYLAIYDSLSGGNMLAYQSISPRTIDINDTVSIAINALTLTEA